MTKDNGQQPSNRGAASAAVASWYVQFGRELLAYCKGQLGDHDGQEVFQTVWQKVLANFHKFQGGNPRAWLYRITKNTIHDMRKKHRPELNNLAVETRADSAHSSLEYFVQAEMHREFQRCVERLDPERKQLLKMRILGDSYKAIAETLAIPMGTVGSRFNRIKDDVRSCVEGATQ